MNICLCAMTQMLARRYFRGFVVDPALFCDDQEYRPYVYSDEKADCTVTRYQQLARVHLAVMLDDEPIGEIVLKDVKPELKQCTLGISMRSDEFKNKGYGTTAEILALHYAFDKLKMETVLADSLLKNTRSQHVLKKVGFIETHRDDSFIYYRCDKATWIDPTQPETV